MRLIDADKLKKDDEVTQWLSRDAVRTGKMLKMFSELFVKKIDDAPTVQSIPLDVALDIVHKTIYTFFDVADDDSEEPISAKDELLLRVNKSIGAKLKGYVNEC